MIYRPMYPLCLCLVLLAAALFPARPAHAAGVVGEGTAGSCSEAALTAALLGGGTVSFNCGGPATILVSSEKVIAQDTIIQGGGVITLTAELATRLFRVSDFVLLTLNDIILDSGYSPNDSGGAMYSTGTLALNGVTIQHSQTDAQHCGGDGTGQVSNDAANHVSDDSCGPQFTAKGDPQLGPLQMDRLGG